MLYLTPSVFGASKAQSGRKRRRPSPQPDLLHPKPGFTTRKPLLRQGLHCLQTQDPGSAGACAGRRAPPRALPRPAPGVLGFPRSAIATWGQASARPRPQSAPPLHWPPLLPLLRHRALRSGWSLPSQKCPPNTVRQRRSHRGREMFVPQALP